MLALDDERREAFFLEGWVEGLLTPQTSGAEYCSDSSLSSAEGESEQRSVILGSRYEKEDAGPWISYLSVCGVMMAR